MEEFFELTYFPGKVFMLCFTVCGVYYRKPIL